MNLDDTPTPDHVKEKKLAVLKKIIQNVLETEAPLSYKKFMEYYTSIYNVLDTIRSLAPDVNDILRQKLQSCTSVKKVKELKSLFAMYQRYRSDKTNDPFKERICQLEL